MFTSPTGESSAHTELRIQMMFWKIMHWILKEHLVRRGGSKSLAQLSQHVKSPRRSCQHLPVHNTTWTCTRLQVLSLKTVTPGINEACNQGPAPQACERTSLHPQSPNERQTNKLRDRPRLFLDEWTAWELSNISPYPLSSHLSPISFCWWLPNALCSYLIFLWQSNRRPPPNYFNLPALSGHSSCSAPLIKLINTAIKIYISQLKDPHKPLPSFAFCYRYEEELS